MTTQRLSSVTLGVRDMERSRSFYETIGFTRRFEQRAVTVFETDGSLLELRLWEDLADEFGVAPEAGGFRGMHLTCRYDSGEDVDRAYDEWIGAGGVGVRQPGSKESGRYAAVVADPDAHLWELRSGADALDHLANEADRATA